MYGAREACWYSCDIYTWYDCRTVSLCRWLMCLNHSSCFWPICIKNVRRRHFHPLTAKTRGHEKHPLFFGKRLTIHTIENSVFCFFCFFQHILLEHINVHKSRKCSSSRTPKHKMWVSTSSTYVGRSLDGWKGVDGRPWLTDSLTPDGLRICLMYMGSNSKDAIETAAWPLEMTGPLRQYSVMRVQPFGHFISSHARFCRRS